MVTNYTYQELTSRQDELLLPWLDIYETSFPPNERILVSRFLEILREKELGRAADDILLACLDASGEVAGMAHYRLAPQLRAAFLWYLAVAAQKRCAGLGTLIYQKIVAATRQPPFRALIFDVEMPENAPDAHGRQLAERRIQFYRRNGAFILGGIEYMQRVGWHQPPIQLHLMVHPYGNLDGPQAFEIARQAFDQAVRQVGPLVLE